MAAGCDLPERPPITPPRAAQRVPDAASPQPVAEIVEPPQTPFGRDWEAWDAYFLKGKQVGYSHLLAESLLGEGIRKRSAANVQYTLEDQVRFRRGNATFVQHLEQTSTETSQGMLLDFESTLHVGPVVKHFKGVVEDHRLTIETVQGSQRSKREIDWGPTNRGLVAVQQSLRRKPMIEGERRMLNTLSPIRYDVSTVELSCLGDAAVPLIDGEYKKLIEIAIEYVVDQNMVINQTIWTNAEGEIQKSLWPADGLTSYRTGKETALAGATSADDLLRATKIDVNGTLDRPQETTRVEYLIKPSRAMKGRREPIPIAAEPNQYVQETADDAVHVVVSTRDDGCPDGFQATNLQPANEDLTASPLVDFNARLIGQLATAAGKSADRGERQLAIDLAATVRDLMIPRTTSAGMMRASDIANAQQGGSLEHSIFLAAMLRARQIPARLAFGFVYSPGERASMSFHVWNLAFVDGQWISLDPLLGTIAPADRITLTTTNLSQGNEYDALTPIMNSLGQFEIEIEEAEY